jgi:transposase
MDELFDLPPAQAGSREPEGRGRPRLQRPNRDQITLRPSDLESLLAPDHRARLVWAFVEGLDLSAFHERIKAIEGHAGRPPIDPAILMALWLYATLEAVGSARALERLCDEHDAYRWLAGGVPVNYHTLADFRVDNVEVLDELLTQSVAALMVEGHVTLTRVAGDGMRVRASAGAASFRRRDTLEGALAAAEAQIGALRAELDDDPGPPAGGSPRPGNAPRSSARSVSAPPSGRCPNSRPPSVATRSPARRPAKPARRSPIPRRG